MKKLATATASILVLAALAPAIASDIYKWTDEEGNVHYGDRPNGDMQPERVAIASSPTNREQIQEAAEARADARTAAEQQEAAAAAEGPSEEEKQAAAADRAQKCETFKARMQQFVTSRRLYREDENGERVYLDESQVQAARQKVENQITEFCGS